MKRYMLGGEPILTPRRRDADRRARPPPLRHDRGLGAVAGQARAAGLPAAGRGDGRQRARRVLHGGALPGHRRLGRRDAACSTPTNDADPMHDERPGLRQAGAGRPRARSLLTDDGQAVDARHVGLHDERARGVRGRAGRPDRRRDRRRGDRADPRVGRRGRAAARRAGGRLHRGDPRRGRPVAVRPGRRRARDRRGGRATTRPPGRRTTWSCSATTPPTAATSRSASGSPTSSAGRSSTASHVVAVDGRRGDRARRRARRARRSSACPLPAVVTVLEGGVEPRYPTVPGRMKAKKVADRERAAGRRARRARAGCGCKLPPPQPSDVEILGRARRPRPPSSTCSSGWGCCPDDPGAGRDRRRRRGRRGVPRDADVRPRRCPRPAAGSPIDAVVVGDGADRTLATSSAATASATCTTPTATAFASYGGAGWAAAVVAARARHGVGRRDRGRHAARQRGAGARGRPARRGDGGQRAVASAASSPFVVTRQVVGGSALEEMRSTSGRRCSPWPATRSRPAPRRAPARPRSSGRAPRWPTADLVARVVSTEQPEADQSGALKSARVVVGAGRGAGGADGFADLLELDRPARRLARRLPRGHQPRLAAAPRAGRPDRQPDLARTSTSRAASAAPSSTGPGCSSSKTILAINTDADAPMVTKATTP